MKNGNESRRLQEEIAREEQELARLDELREKGASRLRRMKQRLDGLESTGSAPSLEAGRAEPAGAGLSSSQKLALFRSRFRGRPDVFARRWSNPRSGRSGYSPVCRHEWRQGVCEKPRVKCGECPHQAFVPISDQVVLDHLKGRHVVGVYPLLQDETCWFLAADFDGGAWQDDAAALMEVCRGFGLSPAVERSRSGRGAHVWLFFSLPVAAAAARDLGCWLITETMKTRHQLPMASYDRLFPSQDTLPKGGFGNLIALPFQNQPRQAGNTLFLDDELTPHADQWAYLASIPLVEPETVHSLVSEAKRSHGVLALPTSDGFEEEVAKPWTRPPSGRLRPSKIVGLLPETVEAVLAQRLFVDKSGLPSALLNQLKRLAAFQNPEFYKKQSLRLSTALTPRVISCAEELPKHIALPRGCLPGVERVLAEHQVRLELRDERRDDPRPDFEFQGQLTPEQAEAARTLLGSETGILVAPPGSGKTVIGVYLIAERRQSTLILVHRQPLAEQWRVQLALFLGLRQKDVGQIGGGRNRPNGRLDVGMLQSLVRKSAVRDLVADYGQVIIDECHHVPAVSFERVLNEVKARYILGLTATPSRRDGQHPILEMQCGPVRCTMKGGDSSGEHLFRRRLLVRRTAFWLDEAAIGDADGRLILATGRYIGEGFDDPRLDTLFLTMPVSWKGTLIQYAGRLHRRHAGKSEVLVYDYADLAVPVLARMFDRRLRTYRAMDYEIEELGAGVRRGS